MKRLKWFPAALFVVVLLTAPLGAAADDGGSDGVYGIRQVRAGNGHREAIRFNRKSGEAWTNWTTSSPAWVKVPESGPVPPGDYDVLLLPGVENDSVWVMRFDAKSGKTWNYGSKGWEEFSEPK